MLILRIIPLALFALCLSACNSFLEPGSKECDRVQQRIQICFGQCSYADFQGKPKPTTAQELEVCGPKCVDDDDLCRCARDGAAYDICNHLLPKGWAKRLGVKVTKVDRSSPHSPEDLERRVRRQEAQDAEAERNRPKAPLEPMGR